MRFNYSNENLRKILSEVQQNLSNYNGLSIDKFNAIIKRYPKLPNIISMESFRAMLKQQLPQQFDYWMNAPIRFDSTQVRYKTHEQLINQILDKMVQIVKDSYKDVLVHTAAKIILGTSDRSTEQKDKKEIFTILAFLRNNIRYTRDMLNIETLLKPQLVLVKYASMDCDDFAMLAASLLMTVGYRVRFKAIQSPGAKQIHHVYVEVYSPQMRKWIAIDGILKNKPLSFEPPHVKKIIREIQ